MLYAIIGIVLIAIIAKMLCSTDWHPDKLKPKIDQTTETTTKKIAKQASHTQQRVATPRDKRQELILQQIDALKGITDAGRQALANRCVKTGALEKFDMSYFNPIFEKHFTGSEWTWTEYEFWRNYGNNNGEYPSSFNTHYICNISDVTLDNIFDFITLPAAKNILEDCGITPPSKQVKAGIIQIARENSAVENLLLNSYIYKRQRFIFFLFMQTLSMRIREFNSIIKLCQIDGKAELELRYISNSKEIIELGKSKGFSKVPPFVPGGHDCFIPKI